MNLPFSQRNFGDAGPGRDARPSVAVARRDLSPWWFAGGLVVAAVLLFSALEARRQASEQQTTRSKPTAFAAPEAIPELVVPLQPDGTVADPNALGSWPQPGGRQQRSGLATMPQPIAPRAQSSPAAGPYADTSVYSAPLPPPPMTSQDMTPRLGIQVPSTPPTDASSQAGRIRASRLDNPATTVIQGTLINAVMETALDSTRPGQTRAVVTRDIYGFDGTRLLIPRGTRLYGVYEADIAQGQKRAQIRWTRLLRPDGVSVALDSPAADPLGRAGVEGRVNNHFFLRLGNALLGASASIGSALVTRNVAQTSPVVVAVPGATQAVSQTMPPNQIAPTLTVRQGTRITVFVQHDLDFTSVEGPQ